MPLYNAPDPLYSRPRPKSVPLPYKEPPPRTLNLSPKPRGQLNLQSKQPSSQPPKNASSFTPNSFGKDKNSNAYRDYSDGLTNQNSRTRKLANGRKKPFGKEIPKGNNATKPSPKNASMARLEAQAARAREKIKVGIKALGVLSLGKAALNGLVVWAAIELPFARRAGITDEERRRAIAQYYPGSSEIIAETPPPFEGGQIAGEAYLVSCHWGTGGRQEELDGTKIKLGEVTVTGKVKNVTCSVSSYSSSENTYRMNIVHAANSDGSGEASRTTTVRRSKDFPSYTPYAEVIKRDGDPNTDVSLPTEIITSPRIAPQPQPPFPVDETIIDDSPVAYSRIPKPSKQTDPTPPPDDSNEDLEVIKAKLDNIKKRLIDANPGGEEGKSNSAIADKEKADSLEQILNKQKAEQTNLNNGLDLGINNSVIDIPAINPANVVKPVVRKYNPEKLDKLKRQRRVEQIQIERAIDKAERQQKIDKLNNQIRNISGAKISPAPAIEPEKQIDVVNGSKTGEDINNDVTEDKKDEVIQTPQESDVELLAKIGALFTATPLLNKNGFKEAVEEAVCDSSQGGCLKSNVVDPLTAGQNNLTNALQGLDLGLLGVINGKLGDAIPGGIGGYLKKAWEVAQVDKIINMANLITSTHNAAMLSRNLGDTIAEVATQALQFLNIKSPTGEAIDVGEIVGNTVSNLITSLVPENIRTNVSATWLKVNRIHASAVGMASAITQTKNAVLEVQEITNNWLAEIGNNIQEQGIIEEDSYPWMKDDNDYKNPYTGFLNKINNVEEVIEQASSFINSATELKDSTEQLTTSKEEVTTALTAFSATKQTDEDSKKAESASPEIDRLDLIQLEEDEIN